MNILCCAIVRPVKLHLLIKFSWSGSKRILRLSYYIYRLKASNWGIVPCYFAFFFLRLLFCKFFVILKNNMSLLIKEASKEIKCLAANRKEIPVCSFRYGIFCRCGFFCKKNPVKLKWVQKYFSQNRKKVATQNTGV